MEANCVPPEVPGTGFESSRPPASVHGAEPRGLRNQPLSPTFEGRFGRLFRRLPPAPTYTDQQLTELAESMREDPGGSTGAWGSAECATRRGDNPRIPAAYTYFGQFVDHDITFDPVSLLDRINDPDALTNFRTPRFDLDSLYGSGPADEPFQYDQQQANRLLIATIGAGEADLPRNDQEVALIGDPRNDENTIVSQLQVVFVKAHNKLAAEVDADPGVPAEQRFVETQRRLRWHYQWIVVRDFLPLICGEAAVDRRFLKDEDPPKIKNRYYRARKNAYMPIEFSVAAFRFGHSQVRAAYNLNNVVVNRPIFAPGDQVGPLDDLRGGKALPGQWQIDWSHFLPFGGASLQPSRLIDGHLTPALFDLPRFPADQPQSLAFRNLRRGQALQLPSGQDVARHLKAPRVFSGTELGTTLDPTPLWFYILKESEIEEGTNGQHLGFVGAEIVTEVLLGLLEFDPQSYFHVQPDWTPTLPAQEPGKFTLSDLVRYATT
jgi:Animal haem peroxidase